MRLTKRIVMLLTSVAFLGWRGAHRAAARLVGWRMRGRPVVALTYHSVDAGTAAGFEWQMRQIKGRSRPVFANDATRADGPPSPSVAVTFDDAFQSVLDHALPILERHGIPATIFVPTGHMGGDAAWIHSADARRRLGPVASADALRALDPRRVRIGSHTVTHPRLAGLDDIRLHAELTTSKATLERITGGRIAMLALPYGSWSSNVVAAARRAGYDHVFANVPMAPDRDAPTILVGRVDVSPQDWRLEFRLKMQGAYAWMALAVPAKQEVLKVLGRVQEA